MNSGFSAPPPLELAQTRTELPEPNEGPVQWRERWDFVLTPELESTALAGAITLAADLQFDLPDRLTILQQGDVMGVVSGRVVGGTLTGPGGTVLSRGVVTVAAGNVAPARAIAVELCWTAPDGRYCMLHGHGNGVTQDSLHGIQLALRMSWRKESPIEALGQAMTFLLTRVARPSQLPPPQTPPDPLWKRLTGKFLRRG